MNKLWKPLALVCVGLVFAGCETRTEKTDSGGVLLSIVDFDEPPLLVSVTNAIGGCEDDDDRACAGFVSFGEVTVANVQIDPTQQGSDLQNIEITSYEVTYSRPDAGTRVPSTYVQGLLSTVPLNGEVTLMNFPYMGIAQLSNDPLDELRRLGFDSETGNEVIPITFQLRFFGRTLSGDAVESTTRFWTIDFIP